MKRYRNVIFELSKEGRKGHSLPECDVPREDIEKLLPKSLLSGKLPDLPEVSEVDVIRHYTNLSGLNYGVDTGFYPLGSCTMKYNPKVNEDMAGLPGFKNIHPYQHEKEVQGCLQLMHELDKMLCTVTGMDRVSLQPAAGAHGEMTGLMIVNAYHQSCGDYKRTEIIVPDTAHGTNPASAAVLGLKVVEVRSDSLGGVDISHLKELVNEKTAGLMLTNPNTLGLFDENIHHIAHMVHRAGGLLYYDGANMNAVMGISRPGDMGFDIVHLNLHKTFSTPHGGGGPGSGPVGVKDYLVRFLPSPLIQQKEDIFCFDYERPDSIGRVKAYYGNFAVLVKAYAYIKTMGSRGLKKVSETAVLNANYLMQKLKGHYELPYDRACKHEFVLSGIKQKSIGITALDIAKRLMDYGFHPPTVYFPLTVKEAIMIEPTETESLEQLDVFIEAMRSIEKECTENPDIVKNAPHSTPVARVDEVQAARDLKVVWKSKGT